MIISLLNRRQAARRLGITQQRLCWLITERLLRVRYHDHHGELWFDPTQVSTLEEQLTALAHHIATSTTLDVEPAEAPDWRTLLTENALLSAAAVAEQFRVHPSTVTTWITTGRLPAIRTHDGHHRIPRHAIDTLCNAHHDAATRHTPRPP